MKPQILWAALSKGDVERVDRYIDSGGVVDVRTKDGQTALHVGMFQR